VEVVAAAVAPQVSCSSLRETSRISVEPSLFIQMLYKSCTLP